MSEDRAASPAAPPASAPRSPGSWPVAATTSCCSTSTTTTASGSPTSSAAPSCTATSPTTTRSWPPRPRPRRRTAASTCSSSTPASPPAAASTRTSTSRRTARAMGINIDGVVYGVHAALPVLQRRGGGSIVCTASMAGLTAVPFDPVYGANKHAVVGLVRALGAGPGAAEHHHQRVLPGLRRDEDHRTDLRDHLTGSGVPIIPVETAGAAILKAFDDGETGQAWLLQAGRDADALQASAASPARRTPTAPRRSRRSRPASPPPRRGLPTAAQVRTRDQPGDSSADAGVSGQAELQVEVGEERPQHVPHAGLAAERQAVDPRPGQQHRGGTERERLHRIRAGADAAVEQHRQVPGGLDDAGQRVERADRAVDLAAAVVAADDARQRRRRRRGARRPGAARP